MQSLCSAFLRMNRNLWLFCSSMNQVFTYLFSELLLYRAVWNISFLWNKAIGFIVHFLSRTQASSFILSILWDVFKSSFTENCSKQACVPASLFHLPWLTFHLFCGTRHINIFTHVRSTHFSLSLIAPPLPSGPLWADQSDMQAHSSQSHVNKHLYKRVRGC